MNFDLAVLRNYTEVPTHCQKGVTLALSKAFLLCTKIVPCWLTSDGNSVSLGGWVMGGGGWGEGRHHLYLLDLLACNLQYVAGSSGLFMYIQAGRRGHGLASAANTSRAESTAYEFLVVVEKNNRCACMP